VRIAFFGTPQFAVPTLDALAREHDLALVVAQPDRPSGRGLKMQAPAVAVRARELGLSVAQPTKIRDAAFLAAMERLSLDAAVVVAYGRILPPALLAIPRYGFLNVHASVLPRWRGAAPIQRAIEAGDRESGVTIMRVDAELDHGPVLAIETTPIDPDERAPSLAARLSELGATPLLSALHRLEAGRAIETPQDHQRATLAPKIEKSEGLVRFDETSANIYNRFRAFDPWPGISIDSAGETIRLADVVRVARPKDASPRTILELDESVVVATSDGAIRILEMQRPGKPRTPAGAAARGLRWRRGAPVP
jgi:methionyl-tRNA formyltransferase